MADFDLTQTDAQVQSILNDGQNMQGAGAQTTLTTESVLLKDVNGNYHKILKSSFTEAIRDTLAGLLVNNDKGTTINQIAAIANGDFGSITPANLASVLGGKHLLLPCLYVKRNTDSDGIPSQGWYRIFKTTFTSGMGAGSYMIHVSSGYLHHESSPMTFLLEASFNHHGLFQIGNKIPSVTAPLKKVRAVQKSRTVYFDINVIAGDNWYVTIYPLNGETSNINTVEFTDVTTEDVGTNVTEVTPA